MAAVLLTAGNGHKHQLRALHAGILERKIITQVINLMSAADPAMKYLTSFLSDHRRLMPALAALCLIIVETSIALYILHHLG